MDHDHSNTRGTLTTDSLLRVYLLGSVEFEAALTLQRALAFHTAGERDSASLVLCEHPPLITVGRDGSPANIRCDFDELRARRWPVRWVNRGGGCLLHLPGQLAIYPIVALDTRGLGVTAYVERLQRLIVAMLDDFGVKGEMRPGQPGVWVGARLIASIGVAVRDWVAYFGAVLNINPDLFPFRMVRTAANETEPMTSLARERRGPLRPSLVRERLLEHFTTVFPFRRTALFTNHPSLRSQELGVRNQESGVRSQGTVF
ncbi:MAG TPA: lipoyl(octanoyl) transferase LipB [Gemmataceae bacterium]|nr:lipoyl(octanoyl) transferase LipB [Gemmataceae bacterium]